MSRGTSEQVSTKFDGGRESHSKTDSKTDANKRSGQKIPTNGNSSYPLNEPEVKCLISDPEKMKIAIYSSEFQTKLKNLFWGNAENIKLVSEYLTELSCDNVKDLFKEINNLRMLPEERLSKVKSYVEEYKMRLQRENPDLIKQLKMIGDYNNEIRLIKERLKSMEEDLVRKISLLNTTQQGIPSSIYSTTDPMILLN